MKKITSIVLNCIIILVVILGTGLSPAFAKDNGVKQSHNHHGKAFLKNLATNEKIDLPVTVIESEDGSSTSFEVIVMSGLLNDSKTRYDTTASVSLTIVMYYDAHYVPYSVAMDRSNAKWQKFDNTVTIVNASMKNAVLGTTEAGSQINQTQNGTIGTPSLNTWYVLTPPWRGTYVYINDISYQTSRADSTLRRGGSSWSLGVCVAEGGSASINCS